MVLISSCVEKLKDIESLEFRVSEANVKLDLTMNALGNFPTYLQMDSSLLKKRCVGLETNKALRESGKDFVGSTMWEVTKDPSVSLPPVINKTNIKINFSH